MVCTVRYAQQQHKQLHEDDGEAMMSALSSQQRRH
jgi:hypothetical protein